ncbi:MAG: MFS transporter, partial [Dehalococcoidales bacterium]|nr:MFS transporter [Dehalococcoidales bacterium]
MNKIANFTSKTLFSRFPPGIWLMMALDGCVVISFSLALPFLSLYLHNERGLSMTLVGFMFLVGGICSGLSSITGGMISDRIGRRRTILIISLVSIFTNIFLGLLVLQHAGIWFIAIVYVITRSIVGILTPAVYAVVADITPKERLTEAYAVVRIGGNIGFALGPAIGGYLLGLISYGYLFMLAGSVFALMIGLSYFFLKETYLPEPGEERGFFSAGNFFKDGVFLSFTVLNIMLIISMAHMGSTLSIFSINT